MSIDREPFDLTGVVARCESALAREVQRLDAEIARLQRHRDLRQRQATWMHGWTFDETRGGFTHVDGHSLDARPVSAERTGWPLVALYYETHPSDRSAL